MFAPSVNRRTAATWGLTVLAAACGGAVSSGAPPAGGPSPSTAGGPEILPLLVNSEILKGPNRFLFSLTDRANKLIAAPDVKVHLRYYDVDTADNTVVFEGDRERHILTERRLKDDPTTLEELASQYGVSRERVRQIEVRAFEKLQKAMRAAAEERNLVEA